MSAKDSTNDPAKKAGKDTRRPMSLYTDAIKNDPRQNPNIAPIARITDTDGYARYLYKEDKNTGSAWREMTAGDAMRAVMAYYDQDALKRCIMKSTPWPEAREIFFRAFVPVILEAVQEAQE